jgi:hypothetical protein
MSEEQVEAKENVAEELTEWSEIDVSPSSEKEKVEFEVEGEDKVEAEAAPPPSTEEKKELPELEGIETKGAEKRIRQLVQQKKEQADLLARAETEKQELLKQLNERDQYTVEASKTNNTTSERLLQQQIELAKKSYLDAYDLGEKEKMLEAQEIINKGQVDLSTLSQQRQAIEQYEAQLAQRAEQTQQVQPQAQAQAQAEYDPLAVEWSQKPENSWFNKDQIMTVAALTIDATLKQEGYDSSTPEFYQEVDRRMKTEFPHKFSGEASAGVGSQPTQQVVAGQSRSSTTSAKGKKVKLTQEDVRLAQKWNIPLEKYAAEKARADRAAGEYVPIG